MVGNKVNGDQSTVITLTDDVDLPTEVIINKRRGLVFLSEPEKPKWANYVKGNFDIFKTVLNK